MKNVLLFVLLFSSLTTFARQRPTVTTFTLANGMTVWVSEDHSQPKVFGAVVVKAGAKDCPNSGIAHYLEHLLFKGTDNIGTTDYAKEKPWLDSISAQYDLLAKTTDEARRLSIQRHINELSIKAADYAIPNEFSNLVSRFGGTKLNAYTSFDETVFHNTFVPQYIAQWCELYAERLKTPVFRLFQGELETVYEEKNMYSDNLVVSAAEHVQQIAFAGTPYAYPIVGATDSLKNPRLSEMTRFFRERYVPTNMGLVLCGDISADSLRPLLDKTFGTLKSSGKPFEPTPKARLRDFTDMPVVRLKVPMPIVKIGGRAWQSPMEQSADYAAFKVMSSMLVNDDRTGLIDSLVNSSRLLFAADMGYEFKDFSAWGLIFVPRFPFGSRTKAEQLCLRQIAKLKDGEFSDAALDATKLALKRDAELSIEDVNGRSRAMINAFSHGLDWTEVARIGDLIDGVSRDDVMRVARQYLNDNVLRVAKKFGSYPKEHVKQPGYKPVKPKNSGKQSAYAIQMESEPMKALEPRLLNLDKDANLVQLSPLVKLYTVPNQRNDIYTLQMVFHRGTRDDNRLAAMAEYLEEIGTETHDKHAFANLLRGYGATLSVNASADAVTLSLTGVDRYFNEALGLLKEFLATPKADAKRFNALVKSTGLEASTFFKDNGNIMRAVLQKLARGSRSEYLTRLSAADVKRIGGDGLVSVFKNLQLWQTDIIYCGSRNAKDIENIIKSNIGTSRVSNPWKAEAQPLLQVDENTVYVYDNPSARQTLIGAYVRFDAMPTATDRARLQLWGNYFGGGMQSVLFQEVREFRALAYTAQGSVMAPDMATRGTEPCGFVSLIGTQADKAMTTVTLLDSLLANMPINASSVGAAKHAILNNINNGYPSMRQLGYSVANLRLHGYDRDPSAGIVASLQDMGAADIERFYDSQVKRAPRAIFIVGNKKMLDFSQLEKLGKVVMLKREDIYKK